jgi:phage N-6-adenine-methyltransferase
VSLVKFKAKNHPQQVSANGAADEVDDRETPPAFFELLEQRFSGFDLDVAAAAHNAKCERYYDRESDGLTQPWLGFVWCNPPYSDLESWVDKAWDEWRAGRPGLIVMLLPANRPEQPWWQTHVEPFRDRPNSPLRVEFLPGRLRFIKHGATEIKPNERPPFGCCLLIWGPRG